MSLPPVSDLFRKHGFRFVDGPDKFQTNCTKCRRENVNFAELDDDRAGFRWRCACGFSGADRLHPVRAQTGSNGPAPRDDDDEKRKAFEAARAEFPDDEDEPTTTTTTAPEPEPKPDEEPQHKPPTIEEATALRRALVAAGYCPIPLYGKAPPVYGKNNPHKGLAGWQNLTAVTDEMLVMWARTWPDAVNTGILTRSAPALDLDILNEEAARACEDLVRERHEEAGYVLVRVGLPPKRAIPFRTEEAFDKIVVTLIAPNGSEGQKIEFLADGQQVVVAGIHPDTGQPYRWHGGEIGKITREDLPYIREAEAQVLVDDIAGLLVRDFGYKRAPGRPGKGGDRGGGGGADDWQYLLDNIQAGRELHDSLRDLAAKMVVSGMASGAVVNALRALMENSRTAHDARWGERFDDIPRLVEGAEERFGKDELPPENPPPKPKDPPPPQPQPQPQPQPSTIEKTLAVFDHWLVIPDKTPVLAVLGAIATNYVPGDPVWLGLVAPPSSAKTEILNSVAKLPDVVAIATLTVGALLSGTPQQNRAKSAKGGLLRSIGKFGIAILKDFGSVLSMHTETRAEVLAALREIFDGAWTRHLGTDGGRTLHWEGKLGLVFGSTPAIDAYHAVIGSLGDRWLLSRMAPVPGKEQFSQALKHSGATVAQMRKELAESVAALFAGRRAEPRPVSKDEENRIGDAISLAVRLRGTIERDRRTREIEAIYGAEGTARIGLSLVALLNGLDLLGVERETAMKVVLSVALDSVPPIRRRAYEAVCKYDDLAKYPDGPAETKDIALELGLPTNTARRALEELTAYGLIDRRKKPKKGIDGEMEEGRIDLWVKAFWER